MTKKYKGGSDNISKFTSEETISLRDFIDEENNVTDEYDDEYNDEHEDFDTDNFANDMVMSAIPVVLSQATELAKLVIDNRARNGIKMTDDDIYQIHATAMRKMYQSFNQ